MQLATTVETGLGKSVNHRTSESGGLLRHARSAEADACRGLLYYFMGWMFGLFYIYVFGRSFSREGGERPVIQLAL